jgi:NAD-dependent dihydropyrimidine dehydrogenase PreA subunit
MAQLSIPVHVGSEPPSSWDELEARQREYGDEASPWLQKQRRPAVASPSLDWEALGFDPRWVGFDTADCAAALQPNIYAGHGASEFDRFRRWLAVYESKREAGDPAGCVSALSVDGYALPIDRPLIDANPSMLEQPHHDYPAIDLMVPEGSPVYAVRGGTIARIVEWPDNCWEVGHCEQTCGVGLCIDGDDGSRYIYCHGSRLNAIEVGDAVTAAQLLMWSGNTGRSGAPHLHFEIRVDGRQQCPQVLLAALFAGSDTTGDVSDVCFF